MSDAEAERQKQWLHTRGTDRLLRAVTDRADLTGRDRKPHR